MANRRNRRRLKEMEWREEYSAYLQFMVNKDKYLVFGRQTGKSSLLADSIYRWRRFLMRSSAMAIQNYRRFDMRKADAMVKPLYDLVEEYKSDPHIAQM